MSVTTRTVQIGASLVLHVSGEADLPTLPRLGDAITRFVAAATGTDVSYVDLDGVHLLDDAALGLLLGAAARTRQAGGELVVVCSPGALRHRLDLTGFSRAVRVQSQVAG